MANEFRRHLAALGRRRTGRPIWTSSRRQAAVTAAADRIDQLLGTAPQGVGESRDDGFRVLIELPLTVYYQVSDIDRLVRVLRVVGR